MGLLRKLRFYLDSAMVVQLLIPVVFFGLFLIVPLAAVAVFPLVPGISGTTYSPLLLFQDPSMIRFTSTRPSVIIRQVVMGGENLTLIAVFGPNYGAIPNSLINSVVVTLGASIFGLVIAFVMARYDFPGKMFFRVLAMVPLLLTPFINAFVVRKMFMYDGIISYFIHRILHLSYIIYVDYLAGVMIAQVMTFWPIVYLNVYASMVQIDPSLEEQAENLGAKGFRLFRTVTLPLSLPGLAAGAAVVFIFSLEDLGAPIAFREFDMISFKIFSGLRAAITGEVPPYVASLSLLLLALAMVAFLAIKKYVSLRQYAMVVRGGRWFPRVRKPGVIGAVLIYALILPAMLFTAFPQIGVFMYSLAERWTKTFPEGLTLRYFSEMVSNPVLFTSIKNSLIYAGSALAIIVLLGISTAYVVARGRIPGLGILDVIATSPIAIPGLAIATGYFLVFSRAPFKGTLLDPFTSGPWLLLILAYAIRRSPFTIRAVYAGLQQIHEALEESAMNLGASRWRTLATIVIPLLGLSILGGALVSFVYSMAETSVSVTLGGIESSQRPITYSMYEYLYSGYVEGPNLVAVMAVFIISIQLTVIVVTNFILKQRYAFIGV
ncbi:MAG: iron ABC transporter permease [Desulfurococcales archaeon]|nr:iron ABC transporter permease [Desulfurococcales archaeon]